MERHHRGVWEAPVMIPEQQRSYLEAEKFIFCCVHDVADLWKQRRRGDRKWLEGFICEKDGPKQWKTEENRGGELKEGGWRSHGRFGD